MTAAPALVVVGASLAGLRAVETARRSGFTGPVRLIGAETRLPYDRPPLSKAFLGADGGVVRPFRTHAELAGDLDVDVRLGVPAAGLDADSRLVSLADGTRVPYDALVVATGARPRGLVGTEGIQGVHALRTAEDATEIRSALEAGARTVVVGAGFIGSEIASSARARGLPVTLVEAADVPLARAVGPAAGAALATLHRDAGTDLRLGAGVAAVESDRGRLTGVRLDDGSRIPADLVVLGTGVRPATEWLRDSGIALHEQDHGVLCDATLATSRAGVWAAGDVAHAPNPLFDDELMRPEHWTNAAEQGAAAARHALDPDRARPLSPVPYFWSDWYGHRIQFVGTSHADDATVVAGAPEHLLVLYRRGPRVVGALTVNRPREIMKLRRRIAQRGSWDEAVSSAA